VAPRKLHNNHSTQYILFTIKSEAWAKETTKHKEQWKTLIPWCVKKHFINFTGFAVTKYAWFIEEYESYESGRLQSSIIPTDWYYSYRVVLFLQDSIIATEWYYSYMEVLFLQDGIIPTGWYYFYSVVLFLQGGIIPTMCIPKCRSKSKPPFKVFSIK